MTKYARKPALTEQQEIEIFPLLDAACELAFGQAILHKCPVSRANYLSRVLNGERYRNAILSISTYSPEDYLYGKGLYYNLVIESCPKGLLVAHVENPPETITTAIILCAATRKPVPFEHPVIRVQSRLNKLKARHPNELGPVYVKDNKLEYAIPNPEEFLIVDIDVKPEFGVPSPTPEQRAKIR